MTAGQGEGDFALSRIGQIAVNVKDVDRAVAFYRDVLKLPFLFQAPGASSGPPAFPLRSATARSSRGPPGRSSGCPRPA